MKLIICISFFLVNVLFAHAQNDGDLPNKNLLVINSNSDKKINYKVLAINRSANVENDSYKVEITQDENQSSQKDLFEKLANNKSITTIYISKTMLSMASGFAPSVGNIKTKDISKKIDQIEIYSSEQKAGCREIANETSALKKNKNYEQLMRIKDESDDVTFYGVKNGDAFKEMIMVTMESDYECTVIRMMGNFTADDMKKVAGR